MASGDATDAGESMRVVRVAAPLREQVLEILRQAIMEFRYKPGQRLIERELIEETGVSRTTIREVLRELDAEGLVKTIPQKGAIVVVPTPEEARDLYEVRALLEEFAARRFVERATDAQVAQLRAAWGEFKGVVERGGDIQEMLRAKDGIYDVLLEGSGNRSIGAIHSSLQAQVRRMRAASLSRPGRAERALEELLELVEAAERRDADAAAEVATRHLRNASTSGIDALASSGTAAT